jgi:hypothetical protein
LVDGHLGLEHGNMDQASQASNRVCGELSLGAFEFHIRDDAACLLGVLSEAWIAASLSANPALVGPEFLDDLGVPINRIDHVRLQLAWLSRQVFRRSRLSPTDRFITCTEGRSSPPWR